MIKKYVIIKSSESFLARLVQSSFAYIFIYTFFFLYPGQFNTNKTLVKYTAFLMLINAIFRFTLNFLYSKKKVKIKLKKIFQPFFTSKPIGKGTGLGLSISKKLAQLHQGNLILASNTKHTTFQLTLPL